MKKTILFAVVFGILLVAGAMAHGEVDEYYADHHEHHEDMMSGYWGTGMLGLGLFGWIIQILVIVLLIILIVWLMRKVREKPKKRR